MKPDPISLHGGGTSPSSQAGSSHRQTVPSHAEEMDNPPPYSRAAPTARSSSDSSASAGEDVPLQQTSRSRPHGSYSPPAPMGSTEDSRGPRGLFGSDDRPEDGPFGSLRGREPKPGHGARGYGRQPNMTPYPSQPFDPSKYADQPGYCFSSTGGAWCSESGGCCCSSQEGRFCSSNRGSYCSDHGACCCSDNGGAWCSDNGGVWCSDNGGVWCSDGNVSSPHDAVARDRR